MSSKRIFIISPYTHDDPAVVAERVKETERYFISLMDQGHYPVSVIVACHHLTQFYKVPSDYQFWEHYCKSEMATCQEVHVLMIDGWRESVGVKDEAKTALELGFELRYKLPLPKEGKDETK